MYDNGKEKKLNKYQTGKEKNKQENVDYIIYEEFFNEKVVPQYEQATVTKNDDFKPIDVIQYVNGEKQGVELKARIRYTVTQFPTLDISLWKFQRIREIPEDCKKHFIVSLWLNDDIITIHDITDIILDDDKWMSIMTDKDNEIKIVEKWVSKDQTMDNTKKTRQKNVQLPLNSKRCRKIQYPNLKEKYWQTYKTFA